MAVACEEARFAYLDGKTTPEIDEHMRSCSGCSFYISLRAGAAAETVVSRSAGVDSLGSLLGNLENGRVLHWRLDERIGAGGQGVVYRAVDCRDEVVGEVVALKLARFSPEQMPRIAREVAIAHKVAHANVCRVHSYEVHGDLTLIVMEHVDGGSLAERLGKPLAPAEAIAMFERICDGVQAMHEAGVLHLDLKPQNVLLRNGTQPAVADFGMAVRLGEKRIGGTRGYESPEQREGRDVDERADVYALGKLLAQLVPKPSARIARVIRRATQDDARERYPSVSALRAALAPRRIWRSMAAIAVAVPVALVAVYFIVPPPHGARATWHPELWGTDEVPADAWNVALNSRGEGFPRLAATSHPMFACGSKPWDLFDGEAQYDNWEQGVAFAPPPTPRHPDAKCEPFAKLDGCPGGIAQDAPLCRIEGDVGNDDADYMLLPEHVSERARVQDQARLGEIVKREPCGPRWLVIDLGEAYRVEYVRLWFHGPGEVPRHYEIDAEDTATRIAGTSQNVVPRNPAWSTGKPGDGVPVTAKTTPVVTRKLRVWFDTCSTLDDHQQAPGIGWLYEIEVFSELSRWESWRRWISK